MSDVKLELKPGQSLGADERQVIIFEIRGMIEDGKSSLPAIMEKWNVTRPTANTWRKLALQQLEKVDSGFTRDAIRNMQIGRINRTIEVLTDKMHTLIGLNDIDGATKIGNMLKGHQDSLANITGIKVDTHINVDATQPLVIFGAQRSNPPIKQQSDHDHTDVIEGEVVA